MVISPKEGWIKVDFILFAYALAYNLEEHNCGRSRYIQRLDRADERNSHLLVAELQNLLRDTGILGTHNNYCGLAKVGIVDEFAALLRSGNNLITFGLQSLQGVADRAYAAYGTR